jgi:uncharacterized protein (DUF1697 family)
MIKSKVRRNTKDDFWAMTTYISILRGFNVGGAKKILMSDLKAIYEGLGFSEVTTYIQSGNVIFQAADHISDEQASVTIKQTIFQKYGFDVPVLVRTIDEMIKTQRINPFLGNRAINVEKTQGRASLHVTFLAELPKQEYLESIKKYDYPPDQFVIVGKDVFIYCPNGYGKTKLNNEFFESKLKVSASTRNWRTVNTLVEIANSIKSH